MPAEFIPANVFAVMVFQLKGGRIRPDVLLTPQRCPVSKRHLFDDGIDD
jgi:hypothetical protein